MKKIIKRWLGIADIEEMLEHTHTIAHELVDQCDNSFEAVADMTEQIAGLLGYSIKVVGNEEPASPLDIFVTQSPVKEGHSVFLTKKDKPSDFTMAYTVVKKKAKSKKS